MILNPLRKSLLLIFCHCTFSIISAQQSSSPLTLNGGSVLAMAGKDCVAVAVDKRFGSGPSLVQIAPPKLLVASPQLVVACTGLQTDVQSLQQDVSAQLARTFRRGLGFRSCTRRGGSDGGGSSASSSAISPRALASLTSHILYNRKSAPYYVEPLVIGLEAAADDKDHVTNEMVGNNNDDGNDNDLTESVSSCRPFLCSFDMIGARSLSDSFVCAGAASKSLYGTAEALWRKDLSPQELAQLCGEAFLSALERDCLSGYGALVYLITKDGGIEEIDLDTRID